MKAEQIEELVGKWLRLNQAGENEAAFEINKQLADAGVWLDFHEKGVRWYTKENKRFCPCCGKEQ